MGKSHVIIRHILRSTLLGRFTNGSIHHHYTMGEFMLSVSIASEQSIMIGSIIEWLIPNLPFSIHDYRLIRCHPLHLIKNDSIEQSMFNFTPIQRKHHNHFILAIFETSPNKLDNNQRNDLDSKYDQEFFLHILSKNVHQNDVHF